ncbi:MAG: alpha/beta fold hydrolase [Chloroflexi bacterium]|nr:alpha/beta fold hydrolase [Chloroflexota bacterium]MBV9898695.1 alpha/beta fold hydrolase [Chloroflexota bacterium]
MATATYNELFGFTLEAARRKGVYVADPTPPVRRTCVVNGHTLNFLDWEGDGPPLLLLHGALLQAHVWDFFSLDMREHFHIRALDLPGHGDSGWAPDGDYSRARVSADVKVLIEQLDLTDAVLLGHSFGGAVSALVAAQLHPRIRALVMVDSTLLPSGRPSVRIRSAAGPQTFTSFEDFVQHAATLGRRGDPDRLRTSLYWNARQLPDGLWTWKYDPALRNGPLGPGNFEDIWSALEAFPGPILFVRAGEHSHLTGDAADRLRALANVRMVEVPHAAHNVMSDEPLAFRREVGAFLAAITR